MRAGDALLVRSFFEELPEKPNPRTVDDRIDAKNIPHSKNDECVRFAIV